MRRGMEVKRKRQEDEKIEERRDTHSEEKWKRKSIYYRKTGPKT